MPIIKPQWLKKGQTVGIVAPASPCNTNKQIEFAIETVESLGFSVEEGKHLYDRYGWFAGEDRDRAADINQMFADDEIDAIITLRGGYGSFRTLPYLNFDLIWGVPLVDGLNAWINMLIAKSHHIVWAYLHCTIVHT